MLLFLDTIIITNTLPSKGKEFGLGFYIPKRSNVLAHIVLASDYPYMDLARITMIFPLMGKYILAKTLYHEIGHHYEHQR